jgi:hypothetical protein
MKNFIITEGQLNLLLNFLNTSKGHIHEATKVDNFDKGLPVYQYKNIGVKPDEWNPKKVGLIFINSLVFGKKTEYEIPEEDRNVIFKGPQGDFTIHSSLINKTNDGKSTYLIGNDFVDSEYYKKFSDLMKPPKSNLDFSKSDINNALEIAFKDNWHPENKEFTAGVRGIHTIGEKTGTSEDWSIMNYFDTKDTVKALINQKWKEEGFGDKIQWLSNIFKTDKEFMEILLDKQWNSIKSGFKTESDTISDILDYFENKGIKVDVVHYPPGHKIDRYGGIDFTLKPKNKKSFTIQVKPFTKIEETPFGKPKIQTYGMKDSYKSIRDLDYIVYGNTPNFFFFKNSNYDVLNNGYTVIHNDNPIEISDIK